MLSQILQSINNYFVRDHCELIEIAVDGIIVNDPDLFAKKQYVLILNSKMNDGVYQIQSISGNKLLITAEMDLIEETTSGMIVCGLAIPRAILEMAVEIEEYNAKNSGTIKSESLGDYSVTYAGSEGMDPGWISVFKRKLAPYKKAYLNLPGVNSSDD